MHPLILVVNLTPLVKLIFVGSKKHSSLATLVDGNVRSHLNPVSGVRGFNRLPSKSIAVELNHLGLDAVGSIVIIPQTDDSDHVPDVNV